MQDIPYGLIFIGIAVAYGLQLLLTGWQATRYYKRLKLLRKKGLASVGMSGGKWSGRVYGVLVVDEQRQILHAEKMSGMTIFSTLKPVKELVGMNAADLLDENRQFGIKKKFLDAFKNAAKEYFKPENQVEVPEKMADVKSVRMYRKAK